LRRAGGDARVFGRPDEIGLLARSSSHGAHLASDRNPHLPTGGVGVTVQALVLAPSRARGGGIERYVQTIEWALASQSIGYQRIDLHGSGPRAHVRMLTQSRQQLRENVKCARIVVAHRALLPVASLIASKRSGCGISVVCHGIEVWGSRLQARRLAEDYLMRRSVVRVVAVSSFTAGSLSRGTLATILPPGLSRSWFDALIEASATAQRISSRGLSGQVAVPASRSR
jgi:hypothetical protein